VVTVSKQDLISFFIGPYCGEILCDVLPIDAYHILFGGPWLFDNHVIHDGHANTCALKSKGCSLTLAPLPPKPLKFKPKNVSEKSLYISKTRVERAISRSKPLFASLMVESNTSEVVKPLYPLAQSLLREF